MFHSKLRDEHATPGILLPVPTPMTVHNDPESDAFLRFRFEGQYIPKLHEYQCTAFRVLEFPC